MTARNEYDKSVMYFRIAAIIAGAVLLIGTVFYHAVENLSWVDALYFCTITLATVGYGDIAPKTTAGKLFTVVYVLVGIAIVATFANLALKRAVLGYTHRNGSQKEHYKKNSR